MEKGTYFHPQFMRDERKMCFHIKRLIASAADAALHRQANSDDRVSYGREYDYQFREKDNIYDEDDGIDDNIADEDDDDCPAPPPES